MDLASRYRHLTASQQLSAAVVVGTALRLVLFAHPTLHLTLERRPELQTPLVFFRSLREGVYIYERGTNPYEGGIFHHSPLFLLFFTYIVPASSRVLTSLLWAFCDVTAALCIHRIWRYRQATLRQHSESGALVVALYLLNPYTILSCVARSTTSVDNTLVVIAIASACGGSVWTAAISLAAVTHSSLYPALLFPAFVALLSEARPSKPFTALKSVVAYCTTMATITAISWLAFGWSWLPRTWGVILSVSDLTPNVGMWWYFFTEMFDHFRSFFLGVFQLHCLIYVLPITARLWQQPLLALLVLVGVQSTWKSYPTVGDLALWSGLLACFPEVVANLRHPLFTLAVHLYTSLLLPLLHSLWLLTGTGNANFFYAATMVYGLNATLAVVDALGAGFRAQAKQSILRSEPAFFASINHSVRSKTAWLEWPEQWNVVQLTSQDA